MAIEDDPFITITSLEETEGTDEQGLLMHAIQKEMRRLEYAVGKDPKPEVPIDEVIASLIDFKGDLDKEFDPILGAECKRAIHLAKSHYMAYATDSPERVLVAVGFLQGVTFARAARNVNEK